jgi:hypothetical protein
MKDINFNPIIAGLLGLALLAGMAFVLVHPGPPAATAPGPAATPTIVPTPTITVSIDPLPAKQTGKMQIQARGFAPGETVVVQAVVPPNDPSQSVATAIPGSQPTQVLVQTKAAADGSISASGVYIPEAITSGAHTLALIGQSSGRRAATTLLVRAKSPWMTLGTYSAKPGTTVGLIFGGLAPNARAQLSLEPAPTTPTGAAQDQSKLTPPTTLQQVATDRVGNGSWTNIKLPLVKPGTYTLAATAGDRSTANLVVLALTPTIELSPWSGPPGTQLSINARGFAPGEQVQVFLGQSAQPALSVDADQYGNVWGAGPIRIPYGGNGGALPIRFVGTASAAEVTTPFQLVAPKPWLELTSWSGPPGTPVGFSGGGWAADEPVTVHLGDANGPVVASTQADDYGWLRTGGGTAATGDAQPGGPATTSITFVAVGGSSHAEASAKFSVLNPFVGMPADFPHNP